MKKSLTAITLLAGAFGLYAQGTMNLTSYDGAAVSILIYSPQAATPGTPVYGKAPNDLAPGETVYTGTALGGGSTGSGATAYGNGNNWTIAIYAAPGENNTTGLAAAEAAGTADAVITSHFLTSGGTGNGNAGTAGGDSAGMWAFGEGSDTSTKLSAGTLYPNSMFSGGATVQILAWYSGGGASYSSSSVSGSSLIGEVAALGGTGSPPAANIPALTSYDSGAGLTSFSLTQVVPEPSTIALGVIGVSSLVFRRRK